MAGPENAVEFVTEWWEVSGKLATTLAALRRIKDIYPKHYLLTFCHPQEIAIRAAALQEICDFFDGIALTGSRPQIPRE
ncbi:MAG TPA: hypothetical protein VL155_16465 [Terriglobales bacterium]|jgi:hypothetical protein|nr:hypothetical protein [Terriglobales bacterium]